MRSSSLTCTGTAGEHGIRFFDWGRPDSDRVLVCVHGLTRNARDFDFLAAALSDGFRVVCPDMPGRGESDWLASSEFYGYETYVGDAMQLISHLGAERVDWLGTSMGGMIGMMLASMPESPVRRLVVNDIGPFVPKEALQRIAGYLLMLKHFTSQAEVEAYYRDVHAPFGPLTDAQWAHLVQHGSQAMPDGSWRLKYDPAIGEPFRDGVEEDADLWEIWDAVHCPVLALRGAQSDVLVESTAREMETRGPECRVVEFEGIGHAPTLMDEGQIDVVSQWLDETDG